MGAGVRAYYVPKEQNLKEPESCAFLRNTYKDEHQIDLFVANSFRDTSLLSMTHQRVRLRWFIRRLELGGGILGWSD